MSLAAPSRRFCVAANGVAVTAGDILGLVPVIIPPVAVTAGEILGLVPVTIPPVAVTAGVLTRSLPLPRPPILVARMSSRGQIMSAAATIVGACCVLWCDVVVDVGVDVGVVNFLRYLCAPDTVVLMLAAGVKGLVGHRQV